MAKTRIELILESSSTTPEIPLCFVGNPGIGKTAIVEYFCKKHNFPLVKLLASTLDETDVAGIVVSTAEKLVSQDDDGNLRISYGVGGGARTLSPEWFKRLVNGGFLLLDEFNCARREVQDAFLTLVQSRVMPNGDVFHPHTRIIVCMNDFAQNYMMSPAMKNRFGWFEIRANMKKWLSWLEDNAHPDVCAFMRAAHNQGMDFSPDSAFMDEIVKLFTTPRSLYNLITFCNGHKIDGDGMAIIHNIIKFSVNFVDDKAQGFLKTVGADAKKDRSNAAYQHYIVDGSIDGSAVQKINNSVAADMYDDEPF